MNLRATGSSRVRVNSRRGCSKKNRDPSLWVRLAEIKAPVKLIGADPTIEGAGPPALISKAIGKELSIEYEAIRGTTHFLQMEKPEECVRAMEAFLAKHG